ncbi:MAG TPA: ABC transporter substrate-binding protein [Methylibium sp.]|nr:ABC transporter substrate-binding protein [Methylibium sp.]
MLERSPWWRRWAARVASTAALATLTIAPLRAEMAIAAAANPGSLPLYVAEAKGFFAAEGVAVRWLPCAFGKVCLRRVLDGQADLGTVADLPIALAAHAGARFSVVATINTSRDDTKIVTRRNSGITQASDLVGRSVGLHLGTTAQYALDSLMLLQGADPALVRLVNLQAGEGRTRLLARTVDAAALFEPYAFEAAQALGADALVIATGSIYKQTWNLAARVGPGAPTPADLEAMLRALDRACAWIQSHPAQAQALLRERTRMDAGLVASIWPGLDYALKLDQSLLTTLEGQARWALRIGMVQGSVPNYLPYLQAGPLRRVRPERVTIAE